MDRKTAQGELAKVRAKALADAIRAIAPTDIMVALTINLNGQGGNIIVNPLDMES